MASSGSRVQSFTPEEEPCREQQHRGVHSGIQCRHRAGAPGNQALLEEDQLPHVIPLEVGNEEIYSVNDCLERLRLAKSYLVEMTSHQKNSEHDDKADC